MESHESNENGTVEAEQIADPKPATVKKGGKPKRSKAEIGASLTLGELAERYLKHLEETGKSNGTCFSYAIELKTAQRELGADTLIASLTPEQVRAYFESPAVMKLKSGRPKAQPSFLKTQRVLRLALVWAVERKWLAEAPLPKSDESK
jgi:hypothetical protein